MSILENMALSLMQQAGIRPEQIVQAYQLVLGWQAEIDAFKAGSAGMVRHYNQRLEMIDAKLDHIEQLITRLAGDAAAVDVPALQPLNGKGLNHE